MEILFVTAILFIVIMSSLVIGYVLGGANESPSDASEYKNDFTWTHNTSEIKPLKETIRRMAELAFYSGWRHGKHYGDSGDKEYCFKKFVKGYNKKMKGIVIND